jgi:hypothetical protein
MVVTAIDRNYTKSGREISSVLFSKINGSISIKAGRTLMKVAGNY